MSLIRQEEVLVESNMNISTGFVHPKTFRVSLLCDTMPFQYQSCYRPIETSKTSRKFLQSQRSELLIR